MAAFAAVRGIMKKSPGVTSRTLIGKESASRVTTRRVLTSKILTRGAFSNATLTNRALAGRIAGKIKNTAGSVVIEAAVALPFFLCVVITLVYSLKVIYTHEIIQHALNQTANELSQLSYIYHASGLDGLLEETGDKLLAMLDEEMNKLLPVPEESREELYFFMKGMYEDDLEKLCSGLAKIIMKKYLVSDKMQDADKVLRNLNIIDSMDGLDMSMSGFFENENNDIDLMVKYRVDIPAPVKIFYPLCLVNRACARAWLYGDENTRNEEDIWSLDNFTRGKKIRAIFGANLPLNFPVIAKFSQGVAVMIKSMDLTSKSYQDAVFAQKKIHEYINELAAYNGQEKPWGKRGIVIRQGDIKTKQVLLVIPGNPIRNEIEELLQECRIYAAGNGVELRIERYGYKMPDTNPSGD
ncbi:MAG: hypothetical protein GX754_08030 [Clostridiaceae bacterium]|nr:hypothetical protein [Clostridiaceae bacterium]